MQSLMQNDLPKHVAIIMDGNGRWATKQGLPRVSGHRAGVESVRSIISTCGELKIPALTLFAFSSENWARPITEVRYLMDLFLSMLKKEVARLHETGVQLRVIGDRSRLSRKLVATIEEAEATTAHNSALALRLAINYGGRWDIVQATKAIAAKVCSGELCADDISEETLSAHLALADLPEPDLFIRTSGEYRISNFLLWQLAYTEMHFATEYWPDFTREHFLDALQAFSRRQRRFGLINEQLCSA